MTKSRKSNKRKNLFQRLTMSIPELDKYCRVMRYRRYRHNGAYINCLPLHSAFHYVFVAMLKISRLFSGYKIVVHLDERVKTDKPLIFAATHIGADDIVTAFEKIVTPCWIMLGDPHEFYRNFEGCILQLNGLLCLDTGDKRDRKIAKERMKMLLRKKGNLLILPEGAWNVTPNKPVCHLYPGSVEAAIRCNAQIVPIAIMRNGNTYYIHIGKNIDYEGHTVSEKHILTLELRDIIATMQWKLIEKYAPMKRYDISENYYYDVFWKEIKGNTNNSYSIQDAIDTMFRPKGIVENDTAFCHLQRIKPNKSNAFLFSKRNHD